jgi:hypothetical protein
MSIETQLDTELEKAGFTEAVLMVNGEPVFTVYIENRELEHARSFDGDIYADLYAGRTLFDRARALWDAALVLFGDK